MTKNKYYMDIIHLETCLIVSFSHSDNFNQGLGLYRIFFNILANEYNIFFVL